MIPTRASGGSRKAARLAARNPRHLPRRPPCQDAAKKMKHNRLWCLFQPHTYTRTKALFSDFAPALSKADIIVMNEIYAAREINGTVNLLAIVFVFQSSHLFGVLFD